MSGYPPPQGYGQSPTPPGAYPQQPGYAPQPAYPAQAGANSPIAQLDFMHLRRKFFAIGAKYYVQDQSGRNVAFCHQKLFRLKEDIRIHTDETMAQELVAIRQQQIIDIWGTFTVFDSATNQPLGSFQRKALKSFLKDEWKILDPWNREIGRIGETGGMAILTRLIKIIPKKYFIEIGGNRIGTVNQRFSLFVSKWDVTVNGDPSRTFDRRLALAGGILMDAVEKMHRG